MKILVRTKTSICCYLIREKTKKYPNINMNKTLSNEEGELYRTTRVKNNELEDLRVKDSMATSESQRELSEDALCGPPKSDTQNPLPKPMAQEEKDQGRPETARVSRSQRLKGKPEVKA